MKENSPNESIDLSDLNTTAVADQGFELTVAHPKTGAPTSMKITLLGADSEAYREKSNAFQRARIDRMNKSRRMAVSPDEIEAEATELLVAVTTGWSGFTLDGTELAFSTANVRRVYGHPGWRWLREQVDQAVGDRANFLPKSAAIS